jgi:glycine/D-amino acid oxidase-like deaminating enzyme
VEAPSRRQAFQAGAAVLAGAFLPSTSRAEETPACLSGEPLRASPRFSSRARFVAGERPLRLGSYRLEGVQEGDKFVIHNYGHGGAGITMSWGCALQVRQIYLGYEARSRVREIAILGAGAMGLTAATLLDEMKLGLGITVYADRFPPHTTSDIAGGQWLPASVEHEGRRDYDQILRDSFRMHEARGAAFGVFRRRNFVLQGRAFDRVPRDLVPEGLCHAELPFSRLRGPGRSFETLLVEPPIFLQRLLRDLRRSPNVRLVRRAFASHEEIMRLGEGVVVNCTGLGAKVLWSDEALVPVRGQLVLLPPQRPLNYLLSGFACGSGDPDRDWLQYLFPRHDCVVVGGTYERGRTGEPDPATCRELLVRMRRLFAGDPLSCRVEPFPA